MADRDRAQPHQVQLRRYDGGLQTHLPKGPSTGQILAVVALLPLLMTLSGLAGITLLGTLVGLAAATPLFVIFSPVLVPATLVVGLSVAGFLFSGAFRLTGLSSFSWVLNFFRSKYRSMVYGSKFVQIGLWWARKLRLLDEPRKMTK